MAFVNLPPSLQDIFKHINDRVAKLESGPSQAMYTAEAAEGSAASAQAIAESAVVDAVNAQAAAAQALSQSSQAIQKSVNTITNASNQLTAMNASGITVYSGASATTGARVLMNSLGIVAYNSSNTATLTIDASNGSISMLGSLTSGSTVSGATITGGVIQTSAGNDAVVLLGASNAIGVKSGGAYVGFIESIGTGALLMHYGSTPNVNAYPQYRVSDQTATVAGTPSNAFFSNSNGTNGVTGTTQFLGVAEFTSTVNYTGISTATGSTVVSVTTGRRLGYVSSSRKTKKNIESLVAGGYTEKLDTLKPVAFDWLNQPKDMPYRRNYGLIAEDAAALSNELESIVNYNEKNEPVSISYDRLTTFLVLAIKELDNRIKQLEGN